MKAGNEGVKSRYPVGKVFSYFPVLQELLVLQQWGRHFRVNFMGPHFRESLTGSRDEYLSLRLRVVGIILIVK